MAFVIIASPRTGSTHLTALLHRHSDIICHGEIFHPQMKNPLKRWQSSESVPEGVSEMVELRRSDPREFLRRVFRNDDGGKHVGFKIFNGHNNEILDELIADTSVKKIVLFRPNLLAVYSSSRIAHKIGERVIKTPRESQPLVRFESKKFVKYCRKYTSFYRDVLQSLEGGRQPFHFLNYETINDPIFFAAVVAFIGADPAKATLQPASIKQNSSELLKRFCNPEEVEELLRSEGRLNWLYEGETSLTLFQTQKPEKPVMGRPDAAVETASAP
jgi:LPS sulfotransferase NodH